CNPAPRISKGGRGTPSKQSSNHRTTNASSNPRAHLSTGIIQPQTGHRVLPPPEGSNLSKTSCLVSSVLCYHLTCDPMTHHINSITGNKHRHLASSELDPSTGDEVQRVVTSSMWPTSAVTSLRWSLTGMQTGWLLPVSHTS